MKVFYKVCLRLAIVLIVIGGALAIVGVASGASWSTMDNLPSWIGFNFIDRDREHQSNTSIREEVAYESSDTAVTSDTVVTQVGITEDSGININGIKYDDVNVSEIQLDIDYGTVAIKQGTEFMVESENVSDSDFQSYIDGETLTIESYKKGGFHLFDRMNNKNGTNVFPEITIYVPKDFHGDSVEITLGAGDIYIEKLSANNVFIDAGAGAINANTIIASEEGEFSVGAGEIKIEEIKAKDADINCGAGTVKMEGVIIGESYVECGVGKVELLLSGDEMDYNYDVDCGLGIIRINDRKYKVSQSASVENDSAENDFNVTCGIGNVIIDIN